MTKQLPGDNEHGVEYFVEPTSVTNQTDKLLQQNQNHQEDSITQVVLTPSEDLGILRGTTLTKQGVDAQYKSIADAESKPLMTEVAEDVEKLNR